MRSRTVLAAILSLAFALQSVPAAAASSVRAYYDPGPVISGEESRTVSYIYDGVTRTDFVLGGDSVYKRQAFTMIEFDPSQDDLYFQVRGGDDTYLTGKARTSDTLARFNREEEDKCALVATNGGLWMSVGYNVLVEGSEDSYAASAKGLPANVKKGYNIPWGFTMYGGEIVCSNNLSQEKPFPGYFSSFGISDTGEALMGQIVVDVDVYDSDAGVLAKADGINRLPADDALILYTDRGMASNYCLDDAYEVVIDCGYDYKITPGGTVTGTVTALSKPGETRYGMCEGRLILTARGDRISRISSFSVGDLVTISVNLEDVLDGRTKEWYTVSDCVAGHLTVISKGVSTGITDNTYYPCTILGIKENGNAVMITSYGRQASVGYSYGLKISQLDELFAEMGIESAFLMDGGGSATMWCETEPGGYELTGTVCDRDSSGNYGVERRVLSSLILAVGPPRSGIEPASVSFRSDSHAQVLLRECSNTAYTAGSGAARIVATGQKNPSVRLDMLGGISADTYKYMVIEAMPLRRDGGTFTLGVYAAGEGVFDTLISARRDAVFRCDGIWQRQVVELSGIDSWCGRMNFVRLDLFDDSGVGAVGDGILLHRVLFFETREEAAAFAADVGRGDTVPGDSDGDFLLSLTDASLILKYIAGWNVALTELSDYDCNGQTDLLDVSFILRAVVK